MLQQYLPNKSALVQFHSGINMLQPPVTIYTIWGIMYIFAFVAGEGEGEGCILGVYITVDHRVGHRCGVWV